MDPEEFFIDEWTTDVTKPNGDVVKGIFDKEALAVALGPGIDASNPQIALLSVKAVSLNEGDKLIIKNKFTGKDEAYTIVGFPSEVDGITVIDLEDFE